ncbi:hypothetical protein [Boudabousia marimammalium]|uniref:hypothetical protein n=1 Tax=Boudabousia marimammalium TaxID=156892 RepID=UPI001177ED8F|nr:hypothetical protein [Boudabousia marimammalium]
MDLSALSAFKAKLEAEEGDQPVVAETEDAPTEVHEDTTVASQPEADSFTQKALETATAAILRHTDTDPSLLTAETSLDSLEIGKIARCAIASTIETELKVELLDQDVEAWHSIGDILVTIQEI